jgi:hypothetical protein
MGRCVGKRARGAEGCPFGSGTGTGTSAGTGGTGARWPRARRHGRRGASVPAKIRFSAGADRGAGLRRPARGVSCDG